MKTRTAEEWGRVYDLLVEEAGASTRYRAHFIECCLAGELTEWRFMGQLGMGGKIWLWHDGSLHITCYREDETPAIRRIVDLVNARLAVM